MTTTPTTKTVAARSAATGATHLWRVTWQPQEIRCRPSQTPIRWAAEEAPVWQHDSFGGLAPTPKQCGGCGSIHEPTVTIERIDCTDDPTGRRHAAKPTQRRQLCAAAGC